MTIGDDRGATILFRDVDPSASAVLEEIAHALQHQGGRFAELDARVMRCRREIEAKGCLIEHEARLGIPREETRVTQAQFDVEWRILEDLEKRWS